MAKQVSKTAIGAFVIGSIALLIVGIVIFGSGKFFKKTVESVMFFQGSITGLKVGAPVVFRGVEIGAVKQIILLYDTDAMQVDIPVIVEIDPERFHSSDEDPEKHKVETKTLIERGLRARLTLESIVTGQLMIEMDFFPDTPVRLVGKEKAYPEIPTLPTAFQEITQALEALPLKDIAEQLLSTLNNLEKVINAPELMDTVYGFKTAVDNVNRLILTTDSVVANAGKLVDNLDHQVAPLSKSLQAATGDARKLLQGMDQEVGTLAATAEDALASASKTLQQADRTLATYSGLVDERSEIRSGLSRAIQELSAATRSVGSLSEYLERHPEALLQGKSAGRGQ